MYLQMSKELKYILIAAAFLWLIGFVQIPVLSTPLFVLFGQAFTLHHLLLLLILGYIIRFLHPGLQQIVVILIGLWLLSTFVFPAFGGLGYILLIILLIYIFFSFI